MLIDTQNLCLDFTVCYSYNDFVLRQATLNLSANPYYENYTCR